MSRHLQRPAWPPSPVFLLAVTDVLHECQRHFIQSDIGSLLCCRCGHCKHLTPEYKKLGEAVGADPKLKDRVVVAKVGLPKRMILPSSIVTCLPCAWLFQLAQQLKCS